MKVTRKAVVLIAAVVLCAALVVPALAATPKAGNWQGKVTKGQALSGKNGMPTFEVSSNGKSLKDFTIPGIGAYCLTGYQVVSVYVPHARVRNGKFSTSYRPGKNTDARITLKGRFTAPRQARGTIESRHLCDYDIHWVAKLK